MLATLEGLTRLPGKIKGLSDTVASHTAALALSMLDLKNLKAEDWVATLKPILAHPGFDDADKVIASLLETCAKEVQVELMQQMLVTTESVPEDTSHTSPVYAAPLPRNSAPEP